MADVTRELLERLGAREWIPLAPCTLLFVLEQTRVPFKERCRLLLRPEFFARAELRGFCGRVVELAGELHGDFATVLGGLRAMLEEGHPTEGLLPELRKLQGLVVDRQWRERDSRPQPRWHLIEAAISAAREPFTVHSTGHVMKACFEAAKLKSPQVEADLLAGIEEEIRCLISSRASSADDRSTRSRA